MNVRLISHTTPVADLREQGIETAKELITYAARISNPKNQMNMETADRLIKYLIKHRHWSPFELVDVTLEIETTRDIARQILRHRSFCFQEFSQRYSDVSELGDELFEFSTARMQDNKNRQGSIIATDEFLLQQWLFKQLHVTEAAMDAYRWALDNGIAKEVARKVLPEGLTKSRLFMKGSIRSWIHYLEVRGPGSGTQLEHMQVAEQVAKAIAEVFSVKGLENKGE
jgi:thymidylate synthase (FAD)